MYLGMTFESGLVGAFQGIVGSLREKVGRGVASLFRNTGGLVGSLIGSVGRFFDWLDEDTVRMVVALSGPVLAILARVLIARKESQLQALVESLWVFPIKSCGGLQLHTALVDEFGLKYDRHFILMTKSAREGNTTFNMLSQRTSPKMATIQFGFVGSFLVATAEGMKPLCLGHMPELKQLLNEEDILDTCTIEEMFARREAMDFEHRYAHHTEKDSDLFRVEVAVWNDIVSAERVSDEHDAWFSSFLGREVVLGKISQSNPRFVVHRRMAHPELAPKVAFQDGFPTLMLSSSSMYDVNNELYLRQQSLQPKVSFALNEDKKTPNKPAGNGNMKLRRNRKKQKNNKKKSNEPASFVPMSILRFRANIVVGNTPPFEEDCWKSVVINAIEFDVVKPCDRCTMPGVDPVTGDTDRREELNAIMRSLRRAGGSVFMGQNAIPLATTGSIAVGDFVVVKKRKHDFVSMLRWKK
eukprot:m.29618 g.29618  ORF g.29618 m.29618 type:complete len:469 (+) comp6171_c0_seq1:107-1513(+)